MLNFCSLSSSSNGNCLFITDGNSNSLVDCGISYTKTKTLLELIGVNISDIDAVLVTHEHTDHTNGLGVLSKKTGIPIYGIKETVAYVLYKYPYIKNIDVIPEVLKIGNLEIKSFPTSHDVPSVGYTISYENKKISIATDLGIVTDCVCSAIENSDFAFIESNHDQEMLMYGAYPYHLKKRKEISVMHAAIHAATPSTKPSSRVLSVRFFIKEPPFGHRGCCHPQCTKREVLIQ